MEHSDSDYAQFLEHRGKQILYIDLSGLERVKDAYEVIGEIKHVIASTGRTDLLTLTNVEGTKENWETVSALRGLLRHNKRYVAAGSVIGLTPFTKGLFDMLMAATGRNMAAFNDFEEAKDWLVEAVV
jgi:hypothetical protein